MHVAHALICNKCTMNIIFLKGMMSDLGTMRCDPDLAYHSTGLCYAVIIVIWRHQYRMWPISQKWSRYQQC